MSALPAGNREVQDLLQAVGLAGEALGTGVAVVDGSGRFLYANAQAAEVLGSTVPELVGSRAGVWLPGIDLEMVYRRGKPMPVGVVNLKTGQVFVVAQPLQPCCGVPGAAVTILSPQQATAIRGELGITDRELQAVIEASFDEVFITDTAGTTLRVNAACERLYGVKESELVGRNVRDLEAEGFFTPSITARVVESRQPYTTVQETRTGRRLMVTASPVFDEEGQVVRTVTVSRDISSSDRLTARLAETEMLAARLREELAQLRARQEKETVAVFRSTAMERVLELARQVAPVDATVLITGESGVGKEQVARFIHRSSHRAAGPFLKIDCGALPENLIESELFGYEAGAFTGAHRAGKRGLIEMADGGSLFLDEIGELSLPLQAKLLRFIQDRQLVRVGGLKPISVDVRIMAATNKNLEEMSRVGSFREDLYYRLNVVPIAMPPLRERVEDIVVLVDHFLSRAAEKYKRTRTLAPETLDYLLRYHWPGNVRELENLIERLVVTCPGPIITPDILPETIRTSHRAGGGSPAVQVTGLMPLQEAVETVERQLLAIARQQGKTTYEMAALLGVNQSTVVRKLQRYFPEANRH